MRPAEGKSGDLSRAISDPGASTPYHRPMVLAANVWHWWISVPLVAGAVLAVVATVVGYFVKMNQLKYPKK
jgi:hypothetical protein